jgi:hypothetical protein
MRRVHNPQGLKPIHCRGVMSELKLRPPETARHLRKFLKQFWQGLREWSGDAAYEKYASWAARSESKTRLSPTEFYVQQLNRKYSRPNRCC